jgi:hypothetical protein
MSRGRERKTVMRLHIQQLLQDKTNKKRMAEEV